MEVTVTGGTVRGRTEGALAVFRGIPFAHIPIRFGAPAPPRPWPGVLTAHEFGPPPPQSGAPAEAAPGDDRGWLTLNVWSPADGRAASADGLPVMVWIHGGGYVFGSSGLPEYDGAILATSGVVVVTVNYRVGLEGFGQIPGAPANRGLLDQVAALEWVRENIARFGGDPDRVTVFGQSAGAGSIAALLVMPRAAGLFQRAIVQSMPGTFLTPALAADLTDACCAELGVDTANLADVPPADLPIAVDLLMATMGGDADRWGPLASAQIPVAPVVDGEVLPGDPWRGLTGAVPLLVGHTRHEQRLLSLMAGILGQVTEALADATTAAFAPDPDRYRDLFPDPEERYDVVRSDWLFRMPTVKLAEAQIAAGGMAYVYELTWPAPGLGGVLGACHGLDVPLVFGNLTAGQPAMLIGDAMAEASTISRQMRAAWLAFAAEGEPGWPSFESGATRLFDRDAAVVDYPEQASRQIWRGYPQVIDLPYGRG